LTDPRPIQVGRWKGWVRVDPAELPAGFLSDPLSALSLPGTTQLRGGPKKNTVLELPGDPGWILRHYRPKGLHSVLRNSVMASKEANAGSFAIEYERRGVPTAPVLALLERYAAGLFRESLLVTRRIPSLTLKRWILDSDERGRGSRDPERGRRAWLRAFARFVRAAHARGVYHGDLNAANVLVPERFTAPDEGAFVLIDVNRTRFGSPFDARRVAADLSRVGGTVRERSFVLRCYADGAREYLSLRGRVLRMRRFHDLRKRLNRSSGFKRALVALRLK
jgi:hypothetical protein